MVWPKLNSVPGRDRLPLGVFSDLLAKILVSSQAGMTGTSAVTAVGFSVAEEDLSKETILLISSNALLPILPRRGKMRPIAFGTGIRRHFAVRMRKMEEESVRISSFMTLATAQNGGYFASRRGERIAGSSWQHKGRMSDMARYLRVGVWIDLVDFLCIRVFQVEIRK